jgi:hypothetical protein
MRRALSMKLHHWWFGRRSKQHDVPPWVMISMVFPKEANRGLCLMDSIKGQSRDSKLLSGEERNVQYI